jgi:hypothetical protein
MAGMPGSTGAAGRGSGCVAIPTIAASSVAARRQSPGRGCCPRPPPIPTGGCSFAEDPSRSALDAAILFDARTDASVLACEVAEGDPDGLDLGRVGCFSALLKGEDPLEHVLLSDGLRSLQLDVAGGTMLAGPVRLRFRLEGLRAIEPSLLTLRRLAALDRLGRMPQKLFPAERRALRWILALRALDARRHGASQREVAEALFGPERARTDWNAGSDYLRSQVRRLLRFGVRMSRGGWRELLRPPDAD